MTKGTNRFISSKTLILIGITTLAILFLLVVIIKTQGHFSGGIYNQKNKVTTSQQTKTVKSTQAQIKAYEKDATSPININTGQQLVITLDASESQNHRWQLAAPYDTSVIKLIGIKYKDAKQNVTLSESVEEFVFQGVSVGEAIVKLENTVPWNKSAKAEKEITFTINVH